MMSTMRLVLASSALFIVMLDPTRPKATYLALALYTAYSFLIYVLSVRRSALLPQRFLHWLDLVWYMPLIAVTGGSTSMFFFFLFFFRHELFSVIFKDKYNASIDEIELAKNPIGLIRP